MIRTLTDHKLTGLNDALVIDVLDEPGQGGACHRYLIHTNGPGAVCSISFQEGPIQEHGVNGVSQEALLAVLLDRLRGFQAGPYASNDNAMAALCMERALFWLQKRTRERMARGVEGTSTV